MNDSSRKKRFYHYKPLQCLEHLNWLQNYLNQKIWFTRVDNFNDKFEGIVIEKRATGKEIVESPQLFDSYYSHLHKLNPALTPEELKEELLSSKAEELIGKSHAKQHLQSHGVLCLTLSDSNIPMWSHYADNHRGYCVVFELDFDWIYNNRDCKHFSMNEEGFDQYVANIIQENNKEKQEMLLFHSSLDRKKKFAFTKLLYQNQPSEIKEVDLQKMVNEANQTESWYEHTKYIIQNTIGAKFNQWDNEEEYRLIANANSESASLMYLKGYPFLKVVGIIMGEEIGKGLVQAQDILNFLNEKNTHSDDIRERLKEFIYKEAKIRNIEVFVAKKSTDSYKIEREEYRSIR